MPMTLSEELSSFAVDATVDEETRGRTRIALADTLVAILSGRMLPPGQAAGAFMDQRIGEGRPEAHEFFGLGITTAESAAFVNGVLAHADETDSTHQDARFHPGCSVTPVALALAEVHDTSVGMLLDSIAIGYDVGAALNLGVWTDPRKRRAALLCPQYTGGVFGGLGAALRLGKVTPHVGAAAFSYAVQHAGACQTFFTEAEHVEKAVVLGGLPGRSAVFSCELATIGFTANPDPFPGPRGFFTTFGGADSDPDVTRARLGESGLAMRETTIKRYPVGAPIQAACEAIEGICGYGKTCTPDAVLVEVPEQRMWIVDNRDMEDINLQHIVALQLVTGRVDFAAVHRLTQIPNEVTEVRKRVTLVGKRELDVDQNAHGSTLTARVTLTQGSEPRTEMVIWPSGSPGNAIGWTGIDRKAREVLGACGWTDDGAAALVAVIRDADPGSPARALVTRIVELARSARSNSAAGHEAHRQESREADDGRDAHPAHNPE